MSSSVVWNVLSILKRLFIAFLVGYFVSNVITKYGERNYMGMMTRE